MGIVLSAFLVLAGMTSGSGDGTLSRAEAFVHGTTPVVVERRAGADAVLVVVLKDGERPVLRLPGEAATGGVSVSGALGDPGLGGLVLMRSFLEPEDVPLLVGQLDVAAARDRVAVASDDPLFLWTLKRAAPEVVTVWVLDQTPDLTPGGLFDDQLHRTAVDAVALAATDIHPGFVDWVRLRRTAVVGWSVRTEAESKRLVGLGVMGLVRSPDDPNVSGMVGSLQMATQVR